MLVHLHGLHESKLVPMQPVFTMSHELVNLLVMTPFSILPLN